MTTPINVTYYESVFKQNESVVRPLNEIIDDVRNGLVADVVKKIRSLNDQSEIRRIKSQCLPAFLPTLVKGNTTGIIYFDIDKKDNQELDIEEFRKKVEAIPECVFSFRSPQGGLKFGIKTNLDESTETDKSIVKNLYARIYEVVLKHVTAHVQTNFVDDKSCRSIDLKCYLSHDSNAFFKPNSQILTIDYQELKSTIGKPTSSLHESYSPEFIEELLSYVPKTFHYNDRLNINYAVLKNLGRNGIRLLLDHWSHSDKNELKRQLEDQLRHLKFGSIGHLIKVAKANGYRERTGRSRNKIKPKLLNEKLPDLLDPAKGTKQLTAIVQSFFTKKQNTFINVSAGAGKSVSVLKVLAKEIPSNKNVLFLVPTHKLADELVGKFKVARKEVRDDLVRSSNLVTPHRTFDTTIRIQDEMESRSDVIHLRGQDELCRNEKIKTYFAGLNIPWKVCSEECHINQGCPYIEQFNHLFSNIRVMTHNEWVNRPSTWFAGASLDSTGLFPAKDREWIPDYIIIDENIFTADLTKTETNSGNKHSSIAKIIHDVRQGSLLIDAINANARELVSDLLNNPKPSFPKYENRETYRQEVSEYKNMMSLHSNILERLNEFAKTQDPNYLLGIWIDSNCLHFAPVTQPAERYWNIPTLFLDATANERVIRTLIPDVDFQRLEIASSQNINLYQLSNSTVTKKEINDPEKRTNLIEWIKSITCTKGYKRIGLITYKRAAGITGDFDAHLANELGAKVYGHFGAIKGINTFEDVDCLLIVGRQFIGVYATRDTAAAIFGNKSEYTNAYVDMIVRMKDGAAYSINCRTPDDDFQQAVHQHYSIAETKQAIGRARSVHGKPKDIYLFCNESMGLDIEVTDFFYRSQDVVQRCSEESISLIKSEGFVADTPAELKRIGFKQGDIKNYRQTIIDELDDVGIQHRCCNMKDKQNRDRKVNYFIYDRHLFVAGATIGTKTFISFDKLETAGAEIGL